MIILSFIPSWKNNISKITFRIGKFEISISHTTREPRADEVPNKDYYFVKEEEFKRLIKNEEFLEYAKVFDNLYGTSRTLKSIILKKVKMYYLILIGKVLIKLKIKNLIIN